MYFHEASTEDLPRVSGMSIAEKMVVASSATHMIATLFADTANSIEKMNRLMRSW
jgi:hypothetical protein